MDDCCQDCWVTGAVRTEAVFSIDPNDTGEEYLVCEVHLAPVLLRMIAAVSLA